MQPRDAAVLAWIAEQFGVQLDVLSVLLARLSEPRPGESSPERLTVSTVRTHVRRWESAGWVTSHRLPGGVWVTLTSRALRMVARDAYHSIEPWTPQVTRLAHIRAAALVRLAMEAEGTPGEWISERLLEQDIRVKRWGRPDSRRPDALWRFPNGSELGVEVELTLKTLDRYREIVSKTSHWQHGTGDVPFQVLWFTWPEQRDRLWDLLQRARTEQKAGEHHARIDVRELPIVAGTYPTGEQWTLPYEAWRPTR